MDRPFDQHFADPHHFFWKRSGVEKDAAVKRDLIGELPKMRRAGRTDVSDLQVSVNTLTHLSEPL